MLGKEEWNTRGEKDFKDVKDDFQSVLHTLESLFASFVFDLCKTSQNVNILQPLTI